MISFPNCYDLKEEGLSCWRNYIKNGNKLLQDNIRQVGDEQRWRHDHRQVHHPKGEIDSG